jgi:hypothetical protein
VRRALKRARLAAGREQSHPRGGDETPRLRSCGGGGAVWLGLVAPRKGRSGLRRTPPPSPPRPGRRDAPGGFASSPCSACTSPAAACLRARRAAHRSASPPRGTRTSRRRPRPRGRSAHRCVILVSLAARCKHDVIHWTGM